METILRYGLLAVFLALMLTPFGLPVPEDVSLLGAGILSATGHARLHEAFIVGYIGVVGGDVISWTFGRRVGLQPTGFIARLVGTDDIETTVIIVHARLRFRRTSSNSSPPARDGWIEMNEIQ